MSFFLINRQKNLQSISYQNYSLMEESNEYPTQVITVKVYLRKYYYLRINGIKTFEKYRDSIAFNQQTGKMEIAKIKKIKKEVTTLTKRENSYLSNIIYEENGNC